MGLGAQGISLVRRNAVRTELALLHTTCRYLQRVAQATHQDQRLVFDVDAMIYTYGTCTHTLRGGVVYGFMPSQRGPPARPCGVLTTPVTFSSNSMIFHPNGIISSGSVYLSDNKRSCCYALSNSVSQVSYLRSYEFRDKWYAIGG
jgi:hypothetical protein